jgi:hypothetical protein
MDEAISRVLESLERNAVWTESMKRETLADDLEYRESERDAARAAHERIVAENKGKRRVKSRLNAEQEARDARDKADWEYCEARRRLSEYQGEPVPTRDDAIAKITDLIKQFVKESE